MNVEIEAVLRNFRVGVPHCGPLKVTKGSVWRCLARVGQLSGLQSPFPTLHRFRGRKPELSKRRFGIGDAEPCPVPRAGVDAPDLAPLKIPEQFWIIVIEGLKSGSKEYSMLVKLNVHHAERPRLFLVFLVFDHTEREY